MLALSDQIVADGGTPWCVGFESGGATGWPATDWMEDIMLRTAGVDTYDQWVTHEIPFNDPAVVHARRGSSATSCSTTATSWVERRTTPSISRSEPRRFRCSMTRPSCWLHRQASFIIGAAPFPEDAVSRHGLRLVPAARRRQEGDPVRRGRYAVVGTNGNRPEVHELPGAVLRRADPMRPRAASAGLVEDLGEHQRRAGLLREPDPRRLFGGPDRRDRRTTPVASTPPT